MSLKVEVQLVVVFGSIQGQPMQLRNFHSTMEKEQHGVSRIGLTKKKTSLYSNHLMIQFIQLWVYMWCCYLHFFLASFLILISYFKIILKLSGLANPTEKFSLYHGERAIWCKQLYVFIQLKYDNMYGCMYVLLYVCICMQCLIPG